ncbi:Uncharacterized protein FKW44_015222 [Caligus rogercresseyi]|uniref:Uncharacterized protein n=1 Tax=Caligus rogercresseyi TaxID=217165 RepID=A0A7T8H028_CALRO|nr:Uncharacterized protein FKW44_015222 [Caligus rogercresseyi]
MLLVLAAFFCSLLTHGTAKTSVFINPDSPFFVKQTPNGEILLRKSSPPSTSSPDFKALNELLDLYMRRNLSAPRTERPSYYYPLFNTPPSTTTTSTTTHGPFITFSSTDFHRANNRVTKRWPPQGGGVISGGRLKPFQVVTLSPYKNIMDDSSRNKWPLYNLSSLKVRIRVMAGTDVITLLYRI